MLEQAAHDDRDEAVEGDPFVRLTGDAGRGYLILCDHASNALPPSYGTLGLPLEQLERHIGYDIGAAGVTKRLAALLGVPAVLSGYSRLLIDPNRGTDDPTLIMRLSDGAIVPGNAGIDQTEVARRIARYYAPYHTAIDAAIDVAVATGRPPALVSVHSFTPAWKSVPRPWHVTVLWDRDPRLALPLVEALRRESGLVVGENEPYSGKLKGDCLYRHGTHRGLAHALIEIRQDLIRDASGQAEWAERLARVLGELGQSDEVAATLNTIDYYGSQTDSEGPGDPPPRPIHKDEER
jgi:predicted N-formylglutamate amidohydrolase